MKIVDIDTVTRDNPKGKSFSKDLFIYHGGWHNEDVGARYRLDSLCICIVERGTHTSTLNSRDYVVHAGEVLICHPNDFYDHVQFSDDFYATFLYANVDLVSRHISPLKIREVLRKLQTSPVLRLDSDRQGLVRAFIEILRMKDPCLDEASRTTVILTATGLLIELFAMVDEAPFQAPSGTVSQPAILYQGFLDLLISLPVKPHRMEYYADQLAVTPKYLSQVCKSQSGKTANAWIREYIMNDVHRYLTSSDLSIKEIASRLGFSNFSFFCQSVKRFWGLTPLQIRNGRQG